ncbi:hypothetical protein BKA70DRAFT_1435516 [Coprinopsis sp. MPI-PUGE-AT-0042]|nr:hypothetical protein BKA70DRAFT_1435516 [Coprinopsis sp. MPI-PUGE-AT-0042]
MAPSKNFTYQTKSPRHQHSTLVQFTVQAPWLRELSISVCAPLGWATQVEAHGDVPLKSSLRGLYIANDPNPFLIDDHPLLAKYIDRWFPNLDYVICSKDNPPRIVDLWYELKQVRIQTTST